MSTTSTISLKEHSLRLLDPATSAEEAKRIIDEIHQHFTSLTGLSGTEMKMERAMAVDTAYGKALGLNYAALCLVDYRRTTIFLRGLVAAIRKKQEEFPGEQIKVFYAGCGPYAPFVTLVAPLFDPSELRFSILDINSESLNFAQDLIQKLGLSDYLYEAFLEDAVTFKIPGAEQYHILYSETLDTLLDRECYVPILCNMKPQFSPGVVVIPQNVEITVSFIEMDTDGNQQEGEPRVVFDTEKAIESTFATHVIPDAFPTHRVPFDRERGIAGITLDTIVHVFEDYQLVRGESQLTQPVTFSVDEGATFNTLAFTYNLKPAIGLFTGTEERP